MSNITTGTFNGADTPSGKIQGRRFEAAVGEYGGASWTATINLFWQDAAGVVRRATDATGTVIDLNTNEQAVVFDFAIPVVAWLQPTSYTSGAVKYSLGAETRLSSY
jgi:hypothetical protein